MTTWGKLARVAMDALDIPQTARGGSVAPHKPRGGSIVRQDGGYVLELLGEAPTTCPHCGKAIAPPRTRRRRLVNVVTPSGKILAQEIE